MKTILPLILVFFLYLPVKAQDYNYLILSFYNDTNNNQQFDNADYILPYLDIKFSYYDPILNQTIYGNASTWSRGITGEIAIPTYIKKVAYDCDRRKHTGCATIFVHNMNSGTNILQVLLPNDDNANTNFLQYVSIIKTNVVER